MENEDTTDETDGSDVDGSTASDESEAETPEDDTGTGDGETQVPDDDFESETDLEIDEELAGSDEESEDVIDSDDDVSDPDEELVDASDDVADSDEEQVDASEDVAESDEDQVETSDDSEVVHAGDVTGDTDDEPDQTTTDAGDGEAEVEYGLEENDDDSGHADEQEYGLVDESSDHGTGGTSDADEAELEQEILDPEERVGPGQELCPQCGEVVDTGDAVCFNCGTQLRESTGAPSQQPQQSQQRKQKDPIVAGVLSLLIPGAGQAYNEQWPRAGVAFAALLVALGIDAVIFIVSFILTAFVIGIFGFLLIPLVHLILHPIAAYDAYSQAEKINTEWSEAPENVR